MEVQLNPEAKTRDEIASAYKSEPWWYDLRGFFILTFAYNSTLNSQLNFFGPKLGERHLEVACGTGTLLKLTLLWRKWKGLPAVKIIGIDYAQAMLDGAKKRFKNNVMVTFVHADAAALPFEDASFDTACIANSIHCLPALDEALRDIHRVLKPGGTLAANVLIYPDNKKLFGKIAQQINIWGIKKGILFSPYTRENIRERYTKSGFEVINEGLDGNCYNAFLKKQLIDKIP